ncbi:fibrocystin-L-like [Amphibalanus amphitrite]|uniref:fibrocystin-L-like n=1 Tax=Amphibalanus amphitrite TaxID=1232801 RepID=UPI001C913750|nr:fibrocystin-L-like [Amphibalanus amphitrite]
MLLLTPERRPPARLGPDQPLFVREVGVSTSADPLSVAVTLRVAACANQLPLIRVAGTNAIATGDTSTLDRLAMTADGWGDGAVTNVRNVSASPPPAGSWDIAFNGTTVQGVPTNLTSEGMTLLLSTRLSLPGLVAQRWGECDKYHWNVVFKHHGGRQPGIALDGADIQFQGDNLHVGVWKHPTSGDGRVTHEVLPADLTRLPRPAAGRQLRVAVRGVTGQCAADDDCDVTFDGGPSPEMTAVSAETDDASGDTTITVTGANLGTSADGVRVALAGPLGERERACPASAAAGSELTCTVKALQAGRYTVAVTVSDTGLASGSGEVSVAPRLSSVSPSEGSRRGGTVLTVRGQRLPPSVAGWRDGRVTVGTADCEVTESSSTAASCRIRGDVGAAGSAADVTVTFGDRSAALEAAFTTLSTNAALTGLNVTTASAAGGEYLGITGSGFGRRRADQSVAVGGASCNVTSWTDTLIGCRLPPLGHGEHTVEVNRGQLGLADNSAVGPISVTFRVTDVSPRLVSAAGGALVRLRGAGLAADCGRLEVSAGDLFTCDPLTCDDTEVRCALQRRRRRHVISNNVTHPRYGTGFLWEPQQLTVAPGDLVTWRWAPGQVSSGAVGFAVHQTASQDTDQYMEGGFNSGEKTQQGSFTTMLEDIGSVFYSGPPAGLNVPRMRGVITVAAPPVGESPISVRLGTVEAVHEPATEDVPAFEPSDLCSPDAGPDSCAAPEDPLVVRSADCVTPRVTNVTVTQGGDGGLLSAESELTISGSGFSTTVCHNRVMIGAGPCDVTAATANQLTCRPVSSAGLPHGPGQPLTLTVANRGSAVIDVAASLKYFRWEPTVSGASPASGSPTGGTLLRITGTGLLSGSADAPPRVTVGSAPCVVQQVTLSELTCRTPPGVAGDPQPVTLLWQDAEGQIRTIGNMTFTYDATKTPTLSSAELTSGAQRTLTLSGAQLGTDPAKISVRLVPRSAERRKREVGEETPDDVRPGDDDAPVPNLEDVISLDDGAEEEPAVAAARREDAAFWRRFCHGDCDSFGAFVTSGQLRSAGSGPAVPVTGAAVPSAASEPEQDFVELTPEYVSALHEVARGGGRARRRVHLLRRRRRSVSADSAAQELTCDSVTVTDAGVTCQLPDDLSGSFDVAVQVADLGTTDGTVTVAVTPSVTTASLPAGSQHGGARIRLDGAGFGEDVSVTIGGSECTVSARSATSVECLTPAGELGTQPVVVSSAGQSVNGPEYTYSADSTPVITVVSSADSSETTVVSGQGTALGSAAGSYLTVGGRRCAVTALQDTEFSCELESHLPGGQHLVTFHAPEGGGDSAPADLTVSLEVTAVAPAAAGLTGTTLTITGGKFDTVSPVSVTVCDTPCQVTGVTSTTVTCLAPSVTEAPAAACDVVVTLTGGASVSAYAAFTYDGSLTASATSVTPTRGSTAGGTTITVTGSGFAETGNAVTIDGVTCDVTSESATSVTCVTNGHVGPGVFSVMVDVPGIGFAQPAEGAQFQYVDRWSSPFTWGGSDPPSDGQSVSITAGQTILLDTSTPVLRLILIDGGELIFDPDAPFLELNAEYIVVVGGGRVQIGTEESPHQGQAAITLHGNVRATELPVYGAKVLAVRNGTLELHGRPLDVTWTYLASTAAAGATSITLDRAVGWAVGDEIVIATTGDKFSMGESEKRVISAVSEDGLTLTLDTPLAFEHISSEQTFAGQTVRMRAEVGLLTRNVKVRGSVNDEFTEEVRACAAGFQPGQFDVQTCFHGRYGAETVTDQFGATVMIHAKYQNQHLVTGRIEYVEVTEAGQAFRLGRYPIHFHLNGNVTGSYVRGCAIHRTYNRAVTIHAVDYLLVEHNVAYNTMGHAFFTEDGIEAYNVIQYNLAVFTRTSSSLLNVDVTPASYWVVNPTNIVRHNAAAGGSHFGYWYRTEAHPSGPSFTTSYCPNHAPMGEFYNNSAHSFGRYGLWVFSMDGYFPLSGGEDTCTGQPDVARFGQFLAWRCERGAEVVLGGALRFENFTVVDNEMAGLEMVKVKGPFGNDGPGVLNALVVGRSALAGEACTESGIITPKQYIFSVDGATFVNFDGACTALTACSQCKPEQGGFHHQFRRVVYDNAPNKMKWKWTHESVFHDTDGSLSGEEDGVVLPWTDILPADRCTRGLAGFDLNPAVVTAVCDSSVSIHRMAFNQPTPSSLLYKAVNFTSRHGTATANWQKKRLTHPSGWMALLVGGETHNLQFADSDQLTNISYTARFYFLKPEDRLAVSHSMLQRPDRLQAGGAPSNGSGPPLDFSAGRHGDIHWDNDTYTMSYMVAGQTRSRRAAGPFEDRDKGAQRDVRLVVERCFFEGCVPPPAPTVPTGRPDTVQLWSQAADGQWAVPGEMEDVTIPADLWVLTAVTVFQTCGC